MNSTTREMLPPASAGDEPRSTGQSVSDADIAARLVERGKLKETDLARTQRLVRDGSDPLVQLLVKLGLVSDRDFAEVVAESMGLPLLASEDFPDVRESDLDLPVRFLRESRVVPLGFSESHLRLAMVDPRDRFTLKAVESACGTEVDPVVAMPVDVDAAIERYYGEGRSGMDQVLDSFGTDEASEDDIEHLKDLASEAPVIRVVNMVLQRAVEARASDIHIEPFEDRLKVRYRIDGVLRDVEAPPVRSTAAVISRVKIMSRLNIAERRLPQDGRLKLRVQGKELDLRVSTVPTLHGESVVLRLLDKEAVELDFEKLGFAGDTLGRFLKALDMPHGIVLVTGPTGSGKSTTLYTALSRLNTAERKIIAAEDPVEYQLEGVNQIQVKPQIGLTFASALRSIVRQDPDVIMIGEMRDLETAQIAVQSALTGHLVLSTLHTNDAGGSVTRLLDMGVEDYLVCSTVNGILGQRLVRKLCPHCRQPYTALPEMVKELGLLRYAPGPEVTLYRSVGCDACNHTGFRGRLAILEFLAMSDTIRGLVMRQATARELQAQAVKEGMIVMYEDGLRKAVAGATTVEEVVRVTQEA